jgi:23S rRNA (uracil1939-C5)-methyltransferase
MAAPRDGYRLRAKWVVEGTSIGLFGAEHRVVDTSECRIIHPLLHRTFHGLKRLLPFAYPVLALDARVADSGVLLTLVVKRGAPGTDVPRALSGVARKLLETIPEVKGVAFAERNLDSAQVLGDTPQHLLGETELPHHLTPDQPYHLAVFGGFVQAHAGQAASLQRAIVQGLTRVLPQPSKSKPLTGVRILELYAGAGSLALRLAAAGADVIAVDSFAPSIALLERTAQAQALTLRAHAASAEQALRDASAIDAIIVDPPRRGLSVETRNALGARRAPLLLYVSCEPATLARDLWHLGWLGYECRSLEPFDMIPHSEAVETLALLEYRGTPRLDVLHRDSELIAVNKPPHLPTTPHEGHPLCLLDLVKQLPGCESAAPIHRLDVGTSGVCLFSISSRNTHALAEALSNGQKTYVALAQGVVHKRGKVRRTLLEGRTPRAAETHYQRERLVGTHSLVHAHPLQGRKHQIRRHFEAIGHPLTGDTKYGKAASARYFFERHALDRTFLHCARIELANGLELQAPLAPDLSVVLHSLEAAAAQHNKKDPNP